MIDLLKGININSKGYGTVAKLVMQDRNLHISAKAIYSYLSSFTGGGDSCFPGRSKICYDLGISTDTLCKYMKQLIDNGYISVEQIKEHGRFSHNIYTICATISPCTKTTVSENIGHGDLDSNNNSFNNNSSFNNNNDNNTTATADGENELKLQRGELGKGVVMLTDEQFESLCEQLSLDEINYYISRLADFIIFCKEKDGTTPPIKSHYKKILEWVAEDRKL